jgi:hypothetical protein
MIQAFAPADCPVGTEDVVVARGNVVVVVLVLVLVLVGAADVGAENATTRFDEGASRRFAPMDGVGK